MTSLPAALALCAALAAAPELPLEPPSPWGLGAALGGGWDSSPLPAAGAVASGFGTARAWVARDLRASEDDVVWAELRYDGVRFDAAPDADVDRVALGLAWAHRLAGSLTLRATAAGAARAAGDSARSGWDARAEALARVRLGTRLALRLGAAYLHREASDAAFDARTGRLEAGVVVALWREAVATVRCTLDAGADPLLAVASAGGGYRGGSTGGAAPVVTPTSRGLSADVQQDLPGGLFLQLGYDASLVRVEETSFVAHAVVSEVGWRR
jgi:hypothetical protein